MAGDFHVWRANTVGEIGINVQLVVDAGYKVLDVVARWPGSVHDSRILSKSGLLRRFTAGTFSGLLVGDSGDPCWPWLMTPYRSPESEAQERFNRAHILTGVLLKGR